MRKQKPRRSGVLHSSSAYRFLVHARPGLSAAEHAAEGAALHTQHIALQRDGGIIGAAGVGIENPAAPFRVLVGPHVDQHLLAIQVGFGVDRISAEIGAALLDANLAFLLFGQPDAQR